MVLPGRRGVKFRGTKNRGYTVILCLVTSCLRNYQTCLVGAHSCTPTQGVGYTGLDQRTGRRVKFPVALNFRFLLSISAYRVLWIILRVSLILG